MKNKLWLNRFHVIVFYDSWCPYCIKFKKIVSKLDSLNLLTFKTIREVKLLEQYNLNNDNVRLSMHVVHKGNSVSQGFDSIQVISYRIIWLWPIVPLFLILKGIGLGDYVYKYIVETRKIIPVSKCTMQCELKNENER